MTSLVTTVTETLRYRGAIGQWSWMLHRLSGVGVVLFLILHVVDTSWAVFWPQLYEEAIATYQSPLFTIGEFGLVAAVVYHAMNGLRIVFFDYKPHLWRHQERAAKVVALVTLVILAPVFLLMFGHVLDFYNSAPQVLPLLEVLRAQLVFLPGFVAAIVAALLLSGLHGLIAAGDSGAAGVQNSRSERFWWSFMRVSSILILPLVFGHLAVMHVLQGVFDITAQGHDVVGTGGLINESGTAVEFVAQRWNLLVGGVAVWRAYDFALLVLVVAHGFNGLRYVLTDYSAHSPFLRRAGVYLCMLGALVLLILGVGALLGTIDDTAIEMGVEAMERLHAGS